MANFPEIGDTVTILKGEYAGQTGSVVGYAPNEFSCFTVHPNEANKVQYLSPYEVSVIE